MTDDGMDPLHDGIGKFIVAAVNLEAQVNIALGIATDTSYRTVEAWGWDKRLREYRALASDLPARERDELLKALEVADEVFDFRNGVVHGVPLGDGAGVRQTQRPGRGGKPGEKFVVVTHDRDRLLAMGRKANGVRKVLFRLFMVSPRPDGTD